MKRLFTVITIIFALLGVFFTAMSIYMMMNAGRTRSPSSHSYANMGAIATGTKLYAVEQKKNTGTGTFPAGSSAEITQQLIEKGYFNDTDIVNENGLFIDAHGVPMLLISTGDQIVIVSAGNDKRLKTVDDKVMLVDLPKGASNKVIEATK